MVLAVPGVVIVFVYALRSVAVVVVIIPAVVVLVCVVVVDVCVRFVGGGVGCAINGFV